MTRGRPVGFPHFRPGRSPSLRSPVPRAQDLNLKIPSQRCQAKDRKPKMQSQRFQSKDPKPKIPNPRSHFKDPKPKTQSQTFQAEGSKPKIPSQRSQAKDPKRKIPSQRSQAKDPKPKIPRIPCHGHAGIMILLLYSRNIFNQVPASDHQPVGLKATEWGWGRCTHQNKMSRH